MNKLFLFFAAVCCVCNSYALSGQEYMDRFNTFSAWYQQLPFNPSPEFLSFVRDSTPLANKLRDKWLYELARLKDWQKYVDYYQPSTDINLVCFNQIAHYNLGHETQVLQDAKSIWLVGESRPQACNTLFDLLLKNPNFDQSLIADRMMLALDKNNISLARYLLKQHKKSQLKQADVLYTIYQRPMNITKLQPSYFTSYFYLYGLKRLIAINMDKALEVWEQSKTAKLMTSAHQQEFLAHLALYKAMRNMDDTVTWFNKVKPEHYNELLIDWQIRYALKRQQWKRVIALIDKAQNKNDPCWQYWLARALMIQGKKEEAENIYNTLAKNRNYYGFLASKRLNQRPTFDNEQINTNLKSLRPYLSVVNQIQTLHKHKQYQQASRLLNDFVSELPKEDASALVYWVDTYLQWHGKSVFLSDNLPLNNQLRLRFPLAFQKAVLSYSKKYSIPSEFVYAIIRQESGFREDVVSGAGARGLMQVMPQTASLISKSHKIAYGHKDQLFNSHKNINIGIAYLQQLGKRFSNHPMLVAAAYNAGPRQVVRWMSDSPKEIDLWIETLPWRETRNYLKNVMAFTIVYQYRLNHKADMSAVLTRL